MPESERIPLLASALGQIRVKGWSTGFCWNLYAAACEAAIPGFKPYQTHLSRHCIDMPTQRALRAVGRASARLDDPRYGAANLLIPGCGHLTICRDVRLVRSLVRELIRTETFAHADAAAPPGASRDPMAA